MKAAVLGCGVMGPQIALSLALGGVSVNLWARRPGSLNSAISSIRSARDFLIDHGLAESTPDSLLQISETRDVADAVAGTDFVLEAISEDLEAKRKILALAERTAAADTILSSTTSAISPSKLQQRLARPENFCVAHYAQPAHLVELVEVVPGCLTSDAAAEFTMNLLIAAGKRPVLCPDIPGFLWARIQHAVLREFASLVGRGMTTPEACDTVLKVGYAARLPAMGAFEHADLAGLDLLNGEAAKAVWRDLSNAKDPAETPVGGLFAQGHTGMKSGNGFYDWRKRDPNRFREQRDEEIVRRIKINRARGARAGGHKSPAAKSLP